MVLTRMFTSDKIIIYRRNRAGESYVSVPLYFARDVVTDETIKEFKSKTQYRIFLKSLGLL
jgi:hypothetical protein